jgi:hypothetical protein
MLTAVEYNDEATDQNMVLEINRLMTQIVVILSQPHLVRVGNNKREIFYYKAIVCDLVVGVPGYRSRGPGSIPGTTRFSEK